MSPLQSALLAVAVIALVGASALNLTGRHADWQPTPPHAATAELVGYADRARAWVALQEQNGAPTDVYRYATWQQLGVSDAVGSQLRTEAGCFTLRAEARFVWIEVADVCGQDWATAVQVFGASNGSAEINRRLADGTASGWRGITDADRDAG